jgi:hypothetical protein
VSLAGKSTITERPVPEDPDLGVSLRVNQGGERRYPARAFMPAQRVVGYLGTQRARADMPSQGSVSAPDGVDAAPVALIGGEVDVPGR